MLLRTGSTVQKAHYETEPYHSSLVQHSFAVENHPFCARTDLGEAQRQRGHLGPNCHD
jgi:hypothetical protein